jgi:GxxExxY protein
VSESRFNTVKNRHWSSPMQEHDLSAPAHEPPNADAAPFLSGPEAWRAEVDEIIAAIHPRTAGELAAPEMAGCTATLVIQQAPDREDVAAWPDRPGTDGLPPELAQTEPGVPCQAALKVPFVPEPIEDDADQSTSPAHPAAQASLRAACLRPEVRADLQSLPSSQPAENPSVGSSYGAPDSSNRETEVEEASTREHPVEYPLPPSPFAHVCNAEPRRGGWVFESATSESALLREVVQAATEVHRNLGPGLRAHVYAQCLAQELNLRGLRTERDVPVSISYKGNACEDALRIALLVEGSLLVDVQGIARVEPMHEAHLRTFLVQSGLRSALLINFHEPVLTEGIRSVER